MNNKKVAILMSTYNGEKYIKEQLDSLLNQSYKNIEIYIRDDGSKDKTINIVKEYENKYNNVIFNQGENVGYINSFFNLLKSDACISIIVIKVNAEPAIIVFRNLFLPLSSCATFS